MRKSIAWCGVALFVIGCARKPVAWENFTPPNSVITVSVPGRMREQVSAGSHDPKQDTNVYALELSKDYGYVVGVTNLKGSFKLMPSMQQDLFRAASEGMEKAVSSKGVPVYFDREIELPYPKGIAKELIFKPSGSTAVWLRGRIYVNESSIHQAYVYGPKNDVEGTNGQRFLDSVSFGN